MTSNIVWLQKMAPKVCRKTHEDLFGGHTKKGLNDLCGRECVGKSCTKNVLGKFGEIRDPSQPQKFAYSSSYDEKSPPLLPFWNDRGMNASIFRRPCAYYSARTLFTPCCWLKFVTVMNINYRRYPKTEKFITTKICDSALKRSRTPSVLRQDSSQLQKYKASRMSRLIAVDQNECAWDGGHPEWTVWNMVNYTKIENAQKVRTKTFVFYHAIVIYTTTGKTTETG